MRIVLVRLAPIVDELESNMHDLGHPDPAALVEAERQEVRIDTSSTGLA
jgi:hypothetical protein